MNTKHTHRFLYSTVFALVWVVAFFMFPKFAQAANLYWVGTDGANISVASNWKTTDPASCGGGDASAAPGSSDVAIFDADCDNGAVIDSTWSILGINLNSGYTGTVTQNSGIDVTVGTSDFTQAGGTYTFAGSDTLTISGLLADFVKSGGTFNEGSGTVAFTGLASSINVATTETFNNFTVNKNNGNGLSISSGDTIVVSNTLNLTEGLLSGGTSAILNAEGTISVAATFDGGDARLNFADDTEAQTISVPSGAVLPRIYYDSAADVDDVITLNADTIFYSLDITSGFSGTVPITYGGNNLTLRQGFTQAAGTFIAPSIFTIGTAGTGTPHFTKSGGVFTEGTGTVVFAGAGSQFDVAASETLNSVTISKTNVNTLTIASGDTMVVSGTLTLTDGLVSSAASSSFIEAQGNVTVASTFDGGTGQLTFSGTNNQTYTDNGGDEPNGDVLINKTSGTVTLASNADWNASGQDVTVTDGTLSLDGFTLATNVLTLTDTLQIHGNETITTTTFTRNAGHTIVYAGDGDGLTDTYVITDQFTDYENLTFNSTDGATDTFQLGAGITVAGNWTRTAGTFDANSQTVTLDGTNQTLSGSTTFHNLSKTESADDSTDETLTFTAGDTFTIANTWTLDGRDADDRINLVSSSPGTAWEVDPQTTRTLDFIDVTDSNNINSTVVDCTASNCVNGGGNTNWQFTSVTVAFTASSQSVSETAGTATVTVELSGTTEVDVTVPYTLSGSATENTDYTIEASPATISAGSTTDTITVTLTDDSDVESDETIILTMGSPTNASQGATTVHTITLTSDDSAGGSNTAPAATTPADVAQATDGSGYVTFTTEVTDDDGDMTQLQIDYSVNGSDWFLAEIASASASQGDVSVSNAATFRVQSIDTDTGKVKVTVTWNSKAAFPDQYEATAYLRVTPYDGTTAGATKTSEAFALDNDPPATSAFRLASRTNTSLELVWNPDVDESNFEQYTLCFGTNSSHVAACDRTATKVTFSNRSSDEYEFTGLKKNTAYFATLTSADTFGNSLTLQLNRIVTSNLPTLNLFAEDVQATSIGLLWDRVTSNAFSHYELCYDGQESKVTGKSCRGSAIGIDNQATTTYTVTELLSSLRYYFGVKAIGTDNGTITSNILGVTTCAEGQEYVNGQCVFPPDEPLPAPPIPTPAAAPTVEPTPPPSASPSPTPSPSIPSSLPSEDGGGGLGGTLANIAHTIADGVETFIEAAALIITAVVTKTVALARSIAQEAKDIVGSLPAVGHEVADALGRLPGNPAAAAKELQTALKPIADSQAAKATGALVVTTAAITVVASQQIWRLQLVNFLSEMAGTFQRLWQAMVGSFGLRGKRRPWGRVVEAKTGQPIKGALVQIINHQTKRLQDVTKVDSAGNFSSYLPSGSYEFRVIKRGWELTPKALFLQVVGGEHIYDGGFVAVSQESLVPLVLAMRPTEDVPEGERLVFTLVIQRLAYALAAISWPMLLLGLTLNTTFLLVSPNVFNVGIQIIYLLLIILKGIIIHRHHDAIGSVTNLETGKPLGLAVIRIYDAATDNLIATRVTTSQGKFFLLVPPGVYSITVNRDGYATYQESHIVVRKRQEAPLALSFTLQPLPMQQLGVQMG